MGINARTAVNFARTWNYAYKYRAVDQKYRFEKIEQHHLPQLMDLSRGCFEDESVTRATGSTIDNCRKGMEWVFAYTIAAKSVTNISDICYDNKTNKPMGFRLVHPWYRDPKRAPFSVPEPTLSKQETTLFSFLDESFNQFFNVFPNENVVLKGELGYIDRAYRKDSGLFKVWDGYGMDFPTIVKKSGANYHAGICTARQTKGWYSKLGYTACHTTSPHVVNAKGETVTLPQGEILLYAMDMNTTTSINVKPCWEKMKAMGLMPK